MMITKLTKGGLLAMGCALALLIAACGDAPPTDYIPQYVVQAYLIVDSQLVAVNITRSQSVTDTFKVANGAVPDADVRIITGDRTLPLQYRRTEGDPIGEYYYPDTTFRIQPDTEYKIEVRAKDGSFLTARTTTPGRINWVKAPFDTLQYPIDTLSLLSPDSLKLKWNPVPNLSEYLISVRSLDTAGYGKYLNPPTAEKNRRMVRKFEENDPQYAEVVRWGFLASTESPTVWAAFKWYGKQVVTIYAPDQSMVRWFKMTNWGGNGQYNPLLSNVEGGLGVFTSASVASKEVFLLKNQP
ncbi:MAG: DUF4249 family protein [Bacteroidota bacterium]